MRHAFNRDARMAQLLTLGLTGFLALAACTSKGQQEADIANGDDPIAALGANVESTRYGTAYWAQQSDSNTSVWQQAKDYCAKNGVTGQGQKVNCGAVLTVAGTETIKHPERRPAGARRF
jgi:hypothetical protein